MAQRSTVAKLPGDAQARLRAMYEAGLTLDDIHESLCDYLGQLDGAWRAPSRSAIHRHRKDYEATASKMREAREMATAIATELGEIPEDRTGQLLIDLLRTLIFKVLQKRVEEDGAGEMDTKEFMMLGRALKDVASAGAIGTRQAADIRKAARDEAAREVARKASQAADEGEEIAREGGLSDEAIAALRRKFLGVKVATNV